MVRKTAITTLTVVSLLLGFYVIYLIREILIIFSIAIVFATSIKPIVDRVQVKYLSRVIAIAIVYLAFLVLVLVIGLLIVPPFVDQMQQLASSTPDQLMRLQAWIDSLQPSLGGIVLPNPFETLTQLLGQLPFLAGGILKATLNVVSIFFGAGLTLVIAFYWLLYYDSIRSATLRAVSPQKRAMVIDIWDDVERRLGSFVGGELFLGTVVGVMSYIGLSILGVPFALVLAIVAGITELVPMIGPYIGAFPAVLIALVHSPLLALSVALLYIVIQQLENHVLVPNVMRRVTGLNPLLVLFSLLVGGTLMGVVGAILAVPFSAIVQVLLHRFFPENESIIK